MFLQALHTVVPKPVYTQSECWEIISRSPVRDRLRDRSLHLLQKVLLGNNGIRQRHFAVEDIDGVFGFTPDRLHEEFALHGPALAHRALEGALAKTGWAGRQLDALLICTCTGYLCPGLSSYVSEKAGLPANAFLQDLVGLGCGAAIPSLRAADALIARHPEARVAVIAVEICSAAFYLDDDPGVLISACLFGDGAAATLWSGRPPPEASTPWRAHSFATRHDPQHRETLRFEQKDGYLRNKLHRSVPEVAGKAVGTLFRESQLPADSTVILPHPGGRDVLESLRENLPGSPSLTPAREVLADHGNMSSPSVLFTLERFLETASPASNDLWLTSFGAGFAAHSLTLSPSFSRAEGR